MSLVAVLQKSSQKLVIGNRLLDMLLYQFDQRGLLDHGARPAIEGFSQSMTAGFQLPEFRSEQKNKIPSIKFTHPVGWLIELDECKLIMPVLKEIEPEMRDNPYWAEPVHEVLRFHRDAIKYSGYRLFSSNYAIAQPESEYESSAQ